MQVESGIRSLGGIWYPLWSETNDVVSVHVAISNIL